MIYFNKYIGRLLVFVCLFYITPLAFAQSAETLNCINSDNLTNAPESDCCTKQKHGHIKSATDLNTNILKHNVAFESAAARKTREIDFDLIIDAIQQSRPNRNASHVVLLFVERKDCNAFSADDAWSVDQVLRSLQASGKVVLLRSAAIPSEKCSANNYVADDVVEQMDASASVTSAGKRTSMGDEVEEEQHPAKDVNEDLNQHEGNNSSEVHKLDCVHSHADLKK